MALWGSQMVQRWSDMGCAACRRQWESGSFPPKLDTSIQRHGHLHLCEVCGTYWEQCERFAEAISDTDARRWYPKAFESA
jgi:hypothetical protein